MKSTFILLLLFVSISFTTAQDASGSRLATSNNHNTTEDDESHWLKNRIGIYGSFFSGYGLSYQHQFDNSFSLRTQIFAYGRNDDSKEYNSNEVRLAYGADLQYNLKRSGNTRLYAIAGSFLDYYKSGNNYNYPPISNDYDYERYINVGGGFGIELMAWRNLSFVIEGGYYGRFGNNTVTVYRSENGQDPIYLKEKQSPKTFGFGVGGGISYAF